MFFKFPWNWFSGTLLKVCNKLSSRLTVFYRKQLHNHNLHYSDHNNDNNVIRIQLIYGYVTVFYQNGETTGQHAENFQQCLKHLKKDGKLNVFHLYQSYHLEISHILYFFSHSLINYTFVNVYEIHVCYNIRTYIKLL